MFVWCWIKSLNLKDADSFMNCLFLSVLLSKHGFSCTRCFVLNYFLDLMSFFTLIVKNNVHFVAINHFYAIFWNIVEFDKLFWYPWTEFVSANDTIQNIDESLNTNYATMCIRSLLQPLFNKFYEKCLLYGLKVNSEFPSAC